MEQIQTKKPDYEAIAWGALLIWWGVSTLIQPLPEGIGAVGIGLILIGINIARSLSGVPANAFSTAIGILALVLGSLELMGPMLHLPFEIPIFAILLIVLGIFLLVRYWRRTHSLFGVRE